MNYGLQFFNSATHSKEVFRPLHDGVVSMYTCGPTVYNSAHIGNLRTYLFEDLVRRMLEHEGYNVHHVMNITDVGHLTDDADAGEDKMEQIAAREKKSVWEIAARFEQEFWEDTAELNILRPWKICKATEHIDDQIHLIQTLERKGFTYHTSDGIYFDISKFPSYANLAQLNLAGMQEGVRVQINPEKRHAADFALWKFSLTHKRQMEWQSPWGVGFPGWHIECSAMSMKYLDLPIDIHCGGIDHIPVHHTNELAQSEAATEMPFVRFWLHGEHLLVRDARMGKSEGNFLTLQNIKQQGFYPLAYRYFVLSAHYRSKLNFRMDALDGAQSAYDKIIATAAQWDDPLSSTTEHEALFWEALQDDLNTPRALAIMWEMIKSNIPSSAKTYTLHVMDSVLGLDLKNMITKYRDAITHGGEELQQMIHDRDTARQEKNFALADALRDAILQKGFIVEDTPTESFLRLRPHHRS